MYEFTRWGQGREERYKRWTPLHHYRRNDVQTSRWSRRRLGENAKIGCGVRDETRRMPRADVRQYEVEEGPFLSFFISASLRVLRPILSEVPDMNILWHRLLCPDVGNARAMRHRLYRCQIELS